MKTINGVYSSELQLSDVPNLGEWKLTATGPNEQVRNLAITEQAFVTHLSLIFMHDMLWFTL